MSRRQSYQQGHYRNSYRKYDSAFLLEQLSLGDNIRDGNDQLAIGNSQEVATATYSSVN